LRGLATTVVTVRDGLRRRPSSLARRVHGCRLTMWHARPRAWRAVGRGPVRGPGRRIIPAPRVQSVPFPCYRWS